MPKKKLLVTDLDGTLIPSGNSISAANIAAAQKAAAAGVTVAIATGRMYKASLPVARMLGLNAPIIAYNGAMIAETDGKILYSHSLEPDTVKPVVEICRANDWHLNLYVQDELYYAVHNEFSDGYETRQDIRGHAVGWDGLSVRTENVTKLLTISPTAEEAQRRQKILQEKFGTVLSCMLSHPRYVEIVSPSVGKGDAVKRLARLLQTDIANVYAIGDSVNDISMLEAAGTSIAMGNAPQNIRDSSTYVTATCENDGFAKAIYDYVL